MRAGSGSVVLSFDPNVERAPGGGRQGGSRAGTAPPAGDTPGASHGTTMAVLKLANGQVDCLAQVGGAGGGDRRQCEAVWADGSVWPCGHGRSTTV